MKKDTSVEAFTVNAFTYKGRGGNPAGVVLAGRELCDKNKLKIASSLGYSETAFIQPYSDNRHHIRFFTPVAEVGLCGHATIASYSLMLNLGLISPGEFQMECIAGQLPIQVKDNGLVVMQQALPKFDEILEPSEVLHTIGLGEAAVGTVGPIQVVSTGLRKILCPIPTKKALEELTPNLEAIKALSRGYGVTGIYCFTLDAEQFILCRNFAPLVGINEDNATGTSVAALCCYLHHHGLRKAVDFPQGFLQGGPKLEPGYLEGCLKISDCQISQVQVAGHSTVMGKEKLEGEV